MTQRITGGCHCGAARYRGRGAAAAPFRCYCRDCQRLTGTGHAEMLPLERDSLHLDGPVTEYRMTAGSGAPTWSAFCATCGAPLTRRSDRMSDLVYVHAASLHAPEHYSPERILYPEAAQRWDRP
ncbi:GFA family protein [Jannaschia seohaensis]|uniref:Uncharacterized conserved protein n=1 Tax=Jannaschia seohaensis TaxID=475081 RepID=A0A2Y9AY90_9RHOB|nr:GFA family protein [Jannaschia seohaensis]PWJ16971.1 hypothetical protein BCF38_10784 [Jannaschia seohaensis]SSA48248.1 Uncharacterized conserved protein [Jannaschia seohaensis]